ncbi:MAG: hypothetical protein NTZ16_03315, partial [Verrucomicrobia bacterium]|nr:hypothetical protein [Verrucomicrobiota bacterium]
EMFGAPSPHPSPTGRGSEGEGRAALGRETSGDVVLVSRLRAALERLNPALPPEAIDTAISGIGQVPPGGELAFFGKKPGQATGHGSGHETRQESGVICVTGLCSSVNTDEEPDIDADI